MRVIELSNQPRSTLHQQEREREAPFEEEQKAIDHAAALKRREYEVELARHQAKVQRLRDEGSEPAQSSWLNRIRTFSRVKRAEQGRPRPPAPRGLPIRSQVERSILRWADADNKARLTAGIEGEDKVAAGLAQALGDGWTLFRGYRNRRGEIDQLLLGPRGLVAIEVKHRNATVHVDGDNWRFVKFDRAGSPVKRGTISDRRGRSPSQQLKEPVAELERFLAKRGQPISIEPVVILSHPRSKRGSCKNSPVHVVLDVGEITALIGQSRVSLDPDRRAKVERLILKDHNFHRSRRRGKRTAT